VGARLLAGSRSKKWRLVIQFLDQHQNLQRISNRQNDLLKSILLNGSYPDSLLNFRGDLIRFLGQRGYSVHVTAPDLSDEIKRRLEAIGAHPHDVQLYRSGLNPFADFRYCWQLFVLQRRIKPSFVINYTIKPNIWGSIAARLGGVAAGSMVTGIGYMMIEGRGWKRRLVQAIAKRLYAFALLRNRVVIFQNDDDVDDFVAAGIVTKNEVRTTKGSGVNLSHFTPAALPPKPVFLMIARLLRTKGVHEYVEASARVRNSYPDARFLLVGMTDEGPDGLPAQEVAGLNERGVEYMGALADVRPALAEASVYVLPSYREGTPRSVLEAMAMGRPIITTDAPGCRETVTPGKNGLLVPVRDIDALATAMETLAENEAMRIAMGQASLEMAALNFDVERVNADLIKHFGL
jgi:glycosyltransferase involved in cell wall biosynthesis